MATPSTAELLDPNPTPAWQTWAVRASSILLIGVAVLAAAHTGLQFRRWMWDTTEPIRYTRDIDRGFYWGRQAVLEGYANQYEKMRDQQPGDMNWLDYGPLRLGVMTVWAKWAMTHYPQVKQWDQNRTFEFTAPVLWFNTFMEAIGVVSAFLLTRLWARRGYHRRHAFGIPRSEFFDGCIPGLIAAAILWFNPAVVVSAYGWPTWDLWIVPMFLLATLLASIDWWFTAGVVIGIGAMFKGQQLMSIPIFLAWALIVGRPISAVRLLVGVTIAITLVASPWLLTYLPADKLAYARSFQSGRQPALVDDGVFAVPRVIDVGAIVWISGVMLVTVAMPFVARLSPSPGTPGEGRGEGNSERGKSLDGPGRPRPEHREREQEKKSPWRHLLSSQWTWPSIAVIGTLLLVAWPWMLRGNRHHWYVGISAAEILAITAYRVRTRAIPVVAAGAAGAAMLLCMSVFHGSSSWYDCGIHFGTVHWPTLAVGEADNLPGILRQDYGWSDHLETTAVTLPAHSIWSLWSKTEVDLSEGALLRSLFLILLGFSAIGLGLHARRRDPRFLIAIVTPWLMFFCFPPQVHERYLLFAAGISCVCAGISTGMTLLGMLLSLAAAMMTLHTMLATASRANLRSLGDSLAGQFPSLFDHQAGSLLLRILDRTHPDLGFAILLVGFIFLYFTLAMRKPIVIPAEQESEGLRRLG